MMSFKPGDVVLYSRNPEDPASHVEIGVVKSVKEDGVFVAYNTGDTCSKTPFRCLRPIENDYALKALIARAEQLGREFWDLAEGYEDWSING